MVFSGEEFAAPGTARRLKEQGHILDVQGPEYLVHLYEEDPSFPAGLNGRFHGLLADRTRRTAMLFNDRYGMHRVYYHESKDGFYFAAEAKAILAVRPELRAIDPRGLGELVSCGCVLENRTLFDGISVLPGAAMWVLRDGTAERKATYFQPHEWESQSLLEPEVYYREVRDIFSRNLPRYFEGREQIGISLTGGLDTRMIMAQLRPGRPVPALLHLRRDVPRLSGRPRGPRSGQRVWPAPPGHPRRRGVPGTFSELCGADRVPDRRMRGGEPLPGPLRQRVGPSDRPRTDDGELWRRGPATGPGLQARRAPLRSVRWGVSLLYSAGRRNICRAPSRPPTVICRVPAGSLVSLRAACAGTDPALVAVALPRQ